MNTTTTLSPEPLDIYENALIQYLKRSQPPALSGVLEIWGWRCELEPSHIPLGDLATVLYALCERLDLLSHSLGSFPGGRGGFGVMCDAAPDRDWAQCLKVERTELDSPERVYWWRIISVLCSRLRMSEVAKLPGYNHETTNGPFRFARGQDGRVTVTTEL